jgi:hypothetical protein
MIKKLLITALALALVGTVALAQPAIDGAIADGEYANTFVDADTGAVLHWTIDGDDIHLAFTFPARGWAGIGWLAEQSNRKAGADILIVTMQDGAPVLLDMFQASARGESEMDEEHGGSNSYTAFAATFENDVWTVEATRPLVTGQPSDVDIVPGEPMILMFAYATVMDVSRAHARSTSGGAHYVDPFTF